MNNQRSFLRGYIRGRRDTRRRLERELAAMKAAHDELRSALAEWRNATEARRKAEAAIVDFYRNAFAQRHMGASLH